MSAKSPTVQCPVCNAIVTELEINRHLDSGCNSSTTIIAASSKKSWVSRKPDDSKSNASIFSQKKKRPSTFDSSPSSSQIATGDGNSSPTTTTQFHSTAEHASKRQKTSKNVVNGHAVPMAERLRPKDLSEFVGQEHLIGPDSVLAHLLYEGSKGFSAAAGIGSMILWGPSGCGKTTLARLLARRTDAVFKEVSATSSGTNQVRDLLEEAKGVLSLTGRKSILFLDEIHRFNKAQQDIFLPYVEQGHVQLIGATTENPSFKINSALLSRCRVFVLEKLTDEDVMKILDRAIEKQTAQAIVTPSSSPQEIPAAYSSNSATTSSSLAHPGLTPKVKRSIASLSDGDARTALSLLELVFSSPPTVSEESLLSSLRRSVSTRYDRTGDSHYDMISALHKSVRGSDGGAALYWLARMLTAGEDPLYIARRLIVMASEDIGLANNHALPLATATLVACQNVGMPECRINLAHCVAYLAESPKSTRSYEAYNRAEEAAKATTTAPVPVHLRNAPTKLMKDLGYGSEYIYNPSYAHPVQQEYLPPHLFGEEFLKKEGDHSGKLWDEKLLRRWERECNDDRPWSGRGQLDNSTDDAI